MGYFASPFYSGVMSLDISCRPEPMESTYTSSYRPLIERVHFLRLQEKRAEEERRKKIEKRKTAARCHVGCPIFETIYQSDFSSPKSKEETLAKLTEHLNITQIGKKEKISGRKQEDGGGDCKITNVKEEPPPSAVPSTVSSPKSQRSPIINGKVEEKHPRNLESTEKKICEEELNYPDWKRKGWQEKEACWIRPLSERKEYKPNYMLHSSPKVLKPCKRCSNPK